MGGSEESLGGGSNLKSAAVMELVKQHLNTDAGKVLKKKIGLVYQINISPKIVNNALGLSHWVRVRSFSIASAMAYKFCTFACTNEGKVENYLDLNERRFERGYFCHPLYGT